MAVGNSSSLDTFASNLFTDLAPLLTLFGDEVTKQFLATSTTSADTLLLSIAPIGIMTIVVSAIRVGGSRLMKALIGRARDSPDEEAKEILSSTSANVREIWNGNRVVRQTGESKTVTILFDESCLQDANRSGGDISDTPFLWRLSESHHHSALLRKFRIIYGNRKYAGAGKDSENKVSSTEPTGKTPPNLTLNIDGVVPPRLKVLGLAGLGLVFQLVVLVVNAFAMERWGLIRANALPAPDGYVLWTAGTVAITIGTFICGWVVESSCGKLKLEPITGNTIENKPTRAIFLQQAIPEQNLPAYALEPIKKGGSIHISRQFFPLAGKGVLRKVEHVQETSRRAWITLIGTFITVGGFICQNIGTRALHYSAGLLQFGVTLILVLFRAILRHKVADSLDDHGTVEELPQSFEASELATILVGYQCHMPAVAYSPQLDQSPSLPPQAQSYIAGGLNVLPIELPRISHPARDSHSNGEWPSEAYIKNCLEAYSVIADCEPSTGEISKMAQGCYDAMEEVLRTILKDNNKNLVMKLRHLVYLKLTRDINLSSATENSSVQSKYSQELASIRFSSDAVDAKRRTRFLRAIIGLTRHAYGKALIETQKKTELHIKINRIVGHCTGNDLQAYVNLLEAWIQPGMIFVRYLKEISEDSDTQFTHGTLDNSIVFGTMLSYDGSSRPQDIAGMMADLEDYPVGHNTQSVTPPYSADFEIVLNDYCENISEAIDRHVVLELLTSFMLQVATQFTTPVSDFIKSDPDKGCGTLVDILMKHGVCLTAHEARLVIVPPLVQRGVLFQGPRANRTGPGTASAMDNLDSESLILDYPERAWSPQEGDALLVASQDAMLDGDERGEV